MEWFDYGKNKICHGMIITEDRGKVCDFCIGLKFYLKVFQKSLNTAY